MKPLVLSVALLVLPWTGYAVAQAGVAYGSINNFDVINDTGHTCYGFEIELDGLRSTDITYTYDYNHYGVPVITEDPGHTKTFVRYQARKNPDGTFASFTYYDTNHILGPTGGHAFTNPSDLTHPGEHFGVGFLKNPTATFYHWLAGDAAGNLVLDQAINMPTPSFTYVPAVVGVAPAQVQQVVVVPPPPAPEPRWGTPYWVKVFTTTQDAGREIKLNELVPPDEENPANPNWAGDKPVPETEVEWLILQAAPAGEADVAEPPDDLPDGNNIVTRRYELYEYKGDLDLESGQAICENPNSCPGSLGKFLGAQMAALDVLNNLGLIDHLQDGEKDVPYPDRTVVVGGDTPYIVELFDGLLPGGLTLDPVTGILSGTPTEAVTNQFSVRVTDAAVPPVIKTNRYTLNIAAPAIVPVPQPVALQVTKGGFRLNRATGRFVQQVIVKNTTAAAVAAPIYLVLDGLGANATLFNSIGTTVQAVPAGSPVLNLLAAGALNPGGSVSVTLEFVNSNNKGITYTARVLAGPGNL